MDGNLYIWNKVRQPPPAALKKIKGGRLSGMTDIKPQWRIEKMTEIFGPCGVGWKYEIKKLWTLPGSHEQVFAFADIDLYYQYEDTGQKRWSDPIPGHGGSMLVVKEKSGLHSSDEGFKMAITDALSTAMKAIGVASDIYMGNWTGSKYLNQIQDDTSTITQTQAANIKKSLSDTNSDEQVFLKWIGADSIANIPADKYVLAITQINKKAEKNALQKTDAWRKWTEAKENCPDIAGGMPEPATEQQCIEATRHIIQKADEAANGEA